jgi:hypothetical protein
MEAVEKMDEAIFERAAKLVRSGKTHPAIVIIETARAGDPWKIIDVQDKMGSEADKDAVSALIDMLSQHPDVTIVAFVSEAWMVLDPKALAEGIRPSQHPKREECVIVSFSIGSSKRAISVHRIVREHSKRPRLERGTLHIETEGKELEGRFFAERRQAH